MHKNGTEKMIVTDGTKQFVVTELEFLDREVQKLALFRMLLSMALFYLAILSARIWVEQSYSPLLLSLTACSAVLSCLVVTWAIRRGDCAAPQSIIPIFGSIWIGERMLHPTLSTATIQPIPLISALAIFAILPYAYHTQVEPLLNTHKVEISK